MSPEYLTPRCPHTASVDDMIRAGRDVEKRIRGFTDEIRSGILGQSGITDDQLSEIMDDPRPVWDLMKEERTALYAVLLEDLWLHFSTVAAESSSGVTEYWAGVKHPLSPEKFTDSPNALAALATSVRNMISGVVDGWRRERDGKMDEDEDTPTDLAYSRMELMNKFALEHDIHGMDSAGVLAHGFTGVQQVAYGLSRVIPDVYQAAYQRLLTAEEYESLLRQSYANFFVRPAHLDKSVGIPLMNAPFTHCIPDGVSMRMDPAMLKIEGSKLALKHEPSFSSSGAAAMKTQAGCPALYAKDLSTGQSVNRAFFEYYVDLVTKYHISRYPKASE